jgi:hypothetical protein
VVALGRLDRFVELCAAYQECGKRVDDATFTLNLYDYNLPLGWLAHSTGKIVDLHSGHAGRAGKFLGGNNIDDAGKFQRLGAYVSDGDTAACRVENLLDVKSKSCD